MACNGTHVSMVTASGGLVGVSGGPDIHTRMSLPLSISLSHLGPSVKRHLIRVYIPKHARTHTHIITALQCASVCIWLLQIACGREHTVGVTVQGFVVSWGCGTAGALGHGSFEDVQT